MQRSLFNRGTPGDSGREENLAEPWNYAGRQGFRSPDGYHTGDPGVWVKAFQVKYGEEFSSFVFPPAVGWDKNAENGKKREPAEINSGDTGPRTEPDEVEREGKEEIKEIEKKEEKEETKEKKNEEPHSPPPLTEGSRLLVWKEFPK